MTPLPHPRTERRTLEPGVAVGVLSDAVELLGGGLPAPDLLAELAQLVGRGLGLSSLTIQRYERAADELEVIAVHGARRHEQLLRFPLRDRDGDLLAVVSVEQTEPAESLAVVRAVCAHAALALAAAEEETRRAALRDALAGLSSIAPLLRAGDIAAACEELKNVVGFEHVAVELFDDPHLPPSVSPEQLEQLLATSGTDDGCVAADQLLLAPLRNADDALVGFVRVDDRQSAGSERPRLLRLFADHVATALAGGGERKRQGSLVAAAPVAVVELDRERCVRSWNAAAERIFGIAAVDALGKPNPIVPADEWNDHVERTEAVLAGGTIDVVRRRFRADGAAVDVRIRCTPIASAGGETTGMLVLAEDVTEQLQTEEELRQAQEIHRRVIENITDVISLIDRDGDVVFSTGPRGPGYGEGGDRRSFADRIHPDDRPAAVAAVASALAGAPPSRNEARVQTAPGVWRIYEGIAVSVRDEQGTPELAMAITRDITDQRQLETERAQARRLESVGRLTAGVAHDFNNLLTVISGYTEIASGDPAHIDVSLDEIRTATARGARLTHQLLAFSRQQVLELEPLDLNQIVLEIQGMLAPLLGEQVRLEQALEPELWSCVADRGQLEQVIVNLALNARDAMPEGGTLHIETANVVLDDAWTATHPGGVAGAHVALTVSDTGQGMDEPTLARIFEPFFTTKAVGTGHGLGLSSTYGIVKQSGGYLEVESTPGKGSRFRVLLPRVDAEVPVAAAETALAERTPDGELTILLVEDDDRVRRLVVKMLTDAGVGVVAVASADAALEQLAAGEFDLLLTDIELPKMSGPELANRVRASHPELPVLLTSGYSSAGLGDLPGPEGTRLLKKPFTKDELAAALANALRR